MDLQRKLLEEMMNPLLGQNRTYKDPQQCTHMLACGFCPFDLFTNTKCDIGFCDKKIHDEKLVKLYQESNDRYKLGHEHQFYTLASRLVTDMDRIIKRQKDKVAQDEALPANASAEEIALAASSTDEREERLAILEGQIKDYLVQLQDLGEKGFVDRAVDIWTTVELLKANMEVIKNSGHNRRHMICDICSATLVYNDSTQRMQDHITGKQHVGYKKLREWIKEWEHHMQRERERNSNRGGSDRFQDGGSRPWSSGGRRDDRGGYRDDRDRGGGGYRGGGGGGGGYGGYEKDRRYRR